MSTSAALPDLTGHDDADLLIGDVARLSGLSIDTLRYYNRAGLLGAVHRDGAGRRVFDRDTLGLLDVVLRLRRTGMPVEDVRHFVDLVRSGDTERAGRLELLRAHRHRVHPRAARGDRRRSHADRHGAQLWHRALRASRRASTGRTARNGAGLSRRGNQIRPTHG
jgi:DNA-binding transcriptional MerR regulator